MATPNPFTPDFGRLPPVLAGRDEAIGRMARVLAAGPARREFTTLMLGPRGVGKTTMASAIADEATAADWRVIRIDAPLAPQPEEGAVAAITERIYEHLDDIEPPRKQRLTGTSLPMIGGGATWENTSTRRPTFRRRLDTLVTATVEYGGTGVLLVVDEFHNLTAPEASRIAERSSRSPRSTASHSPSSASASPTSTTRSLPTRGSRSSTAATGNASATSPSMTPWKRSKAR